MYDSQTETYFPGDSVTTWQGQTLPQDSSSTDSSQTWTFNNLTLNSSREYNVYVQGASNSGFTVYDTYETFSPSDPSDTLPASALGSGWLFVGQVTLSEDDSCTTITVAHSGDTSIENVCLMQSTYTDTYNSDGSLIVEISPLGQTTTMAFNALGLPAQQQKGYDEPWLGHTTWAETTYSYDHDSELTGTAYSDFASAPSTNITASYDANGNRTSNSVSGGGYGDSGPYSGDPIISDNRVLFDGKFYYTYDAEGNVTAKFLSSDAASGGIDSSATDITIYQWDNKNELVDVQAYANYSDYATSVSDHYGPPGGATTETAIEYTYDPLGLMVSRTQIASGTDVTSRENYVYDGQNPVLVLDGSGDVTEPELYGSAVDQVLASENAGTGAVSWMLTDNQGTVRDVAQLSGDTTSVVDHLLYDSFGQLSSQTDSDYQPRFLYTGAQLDPLTNLYYNRARWYDPADGVWLSQDPLGFAAAQTNTSEYVGNSPTNGTDPSGMMTEGEALQIYNAAVANGAPLGHGSAYTQYLRNLQQAQGPPQGPNNARPVGKMAVTYYSALGDDGIYLLAHRPFVVPKPAKNLNTNRARYFAKQQAAQNAQSGGWSSIGNTFCSIGLSYYGAYEQLFGTGNANATYQEAYDRGIFGQTDNADGWVYYGTRAGVGFAAAGVILYGVLEISGALGLTELNSVPLSQVPRQAVIEVWTWTMRLRAPSAPMDAETEALEDFTNPARGDWQMWEPPEPPEPPETGYDGWLPPEDQFPGG
jgi:RHS repeat-associated protein